MVKVNDGNNSNSDIPQNREKLPRQFDKDVTEDVPEKLRTIDTLPNFRPFQHSTIERTKLSQVSDEPTAPFHPPWLKGTGRPKRVTLLGTPKKRLMHHGYEVDPLIIWYPEDRKPYYDTRYPWGCVCRIITSSGGGGSGVIVGPRHVLTASHVIDWDTGAGSVEVHRAGPFTSAISGITDTWSFTKIGKGGVGWSEVDEDYAVIITADRIGDRYGWFGVRTYDSGWDDEPLWRNIGYPEDVIKGTYPIHQKRKTLDEDEWDYGSGRSMTTSADVVKGQSGGPMFRFWQEGPYVVAVVSSESDENWCSGGSDMTRLVRHAKTKHP